MPAVNGHDFRASLGAKRHRPHHSADVVAAAGPLVRRGARAASRLVPPMTGMPLYLFAKAPEAGRVKRRLSPPLDSQQAARVAEALLQQAVDAVEHGWFGQKVLNVSPDTAHPAFSRCAQGFRWRMRLQPEVDLGERMREALQEGIDTCGGAAVLGTDIPALTPVILRQAFQALQAGQQVVGPSQDGGFYLLGLRQFPPALFAGIEWSRAGVYARLMENARELKLPLQVLPTLSDCDYFEDLKWAARHVAGFRQQLDQVGFDLGLLV